MISGWWPWFGDVMVRSNRVSDEEHDSSRGFDGFVEVWSKNRLTIAMAYSGEAFNFWQLYGGRWLGTWLPVIGDYGCGIIWWKREVVWWCHVGERLLVLGFESVTSGSWGQWWLWFGRRMMESLVAGWTTTIVARDGGNIGWSVATAMVC